MAREVALDIATVGPVGLGISKEIASGIGSHAIEIQIQRGIAVLTIANYKRALGLLGSRCHH